MTHPIGILGTGSYLPAQARTNEQLERRLGLPDGWIEQRTGIRERRVAAAHQATSDLATLAARQALDAAGVDAGEIDLIIVASSTPDSPQPATACIVQDNLGVSGQSAAFDLNAVCSGFPYALAIADAYLRAHAGASRALVIGAEVYSRILDPNDPKTSVLFGDGAGAAVLGPVPTGYGILSTHLVAHGAERNLVSVPAGGSRHPTTTETLRSGEHYFHMDGWGVKQFVHDHVPGGIAATLASANLTLDEIDLVIPHQANGVLLASVFEPLGLTRERVHYTVEHYGNTGAASPAVTLHDAVKTGRLNHGDSVLLIAFGGGMTLGGLAIRWTGPTHATNTAAHTNHAPRDRQASGSRKATGPPRERPLSAA